MMSEKPGPIIPPEAAPLKTLTVTMAVMCTLACLAIGALTLINRAVEQWTHGLSAEATVQLRQVQGVDPNAELQKLDVVLRQTPGIAAITVMDRRAAAKLLEPWLGTGNTDDLPIPRLVRLTLDDAHPPDLQALAQRLEETVKGASLDTHQRWQAELAHMARTLSTLAYAILALIAASAVAMVIFATRTVLDANRQVVDVLHLVGAKDGYIARQIDRRFLATGLYAGLIGVGLALLVFFFLGLSGRVSGEGLAAASRSLLFAPPALALSSYAALLAVPVAATAIALITSRLTLIRMLRNVL
jgi:cell division transport system permease protein